MPSTRKQKARERSMQSDVMSDMETLDEYLEGTLETMLTVS